MSQTPSTVVATAIVSHVRPDRKPPGAAHAQRPVDTQCAKRVDCVCAHRQAVAAILEEGRAAYLASVSQELDARECPRCHQRRLLQLAGSLAILTVGAAHCVSEATLGGCAFLRRRRPGRWHLLRRSPLRVL